MTLGSINIESKPRLSSDLSLVQLSAMGTAPEHVLEKMRSSSYDCFRVQLKDIQVSF